MRPVIPFAALLGAVLLLALPAAAPAAEPAFVPGEIEALRAALDAALEGADYQRVTVGGYLRLPGDTRQARNDALDILAGGALGADPDLVGSFRNRNRSRLELWGSKLDALGRRADPGVVLMQNPKEVSVQYGRMGVSSSGEHGLVYLELRPYERAHQVRGVFRVLERAGDGWRLTPGRVGFERDAFGVRPLGD